MSTKAKARLTGLLFGLGLCSGGLLGGWIYRYFGGESAWAAILAFVSLGTLVCVYALAFPEDLLVPMLERIRQRRHDERLALLVLVVSILSFAACLAVFLAIAFFLAR